MAMTTGLRPVSERTVSVVDLVTAEIRRAVLSGVLPPGQQFSVRELARQLGVSHIPVRESLHRLQGQGLIELRHGRSAAVASLTAADLESIYRLRLRIEPELAAASAPLHTDEDLRRLGGELELSRDADPERAWQAHHRFHELLVAPAASTWDLRVLQVLWTAAERYTHLVFDPTAIDDAERQQRYDRHADLLHAARDGSPGVVQAALTAHLERNLDEARLPVAALEGRAPQEEAASWAAGPRAGRAR